MNKNNPMICDMETGICGEAESQDMELIDLNEPKKTVDVYYVTDPICSHCWALEPALRRFTEQYGAHFNFHTVMGGLLEKWGDQPVDPANGIFGPADVAGHWREVGEQSRMPIDGSLMIDNPVQSSYPPSRVYKVIQKHHGNEAAQQFLRRAREALFAFNENISDLTVLKRIVQENGHDGDAIVAEAESESGHQLLKEDFSQVRKLGVRGFPTIIIVNEENKGVKIVGARPFQYYVDGLKQVLEEEEPQATELREPVDLLAEEKLLFSKEVEVMYDLNKEDVEQFMNKELEQNAFEMKEILGEKYFVSK